MRLRIGWIVAIWTTIIALSVLVFMSMFNRIGEFGVWVEAMLFFIPATFVLIGSLMTFKTFSSKNPEKKTWLLFTIAAGSLVVAEIFRVVLHLVPSVLDKISWLDKMPYLSILLCFFFIVWGFWYQQGIIETKIGSNLRVLLTIVVIAFVFVLVFAFAFPIFKSTAGIVEKIFTLLFLIGDLFMFTGALAISTRMWGGTLSKPWILWSVGTAILVAYHMYFTAVVMQGNDPLEYGTGILLAIGLGFLVTSGELRRSLLE
ncbi:MAG: hypothetical protein KAH30_03690 [Caldisericia bacterium]|nr:hypothetical protein [Caldisericia bacterium]